jgi:hypothetical protein
MFLHFRNTGNTLWSVASNWSLTDGGPGNGRVPTPDDDVRFTSNSGNCTIDIPATVASFTGIFQSESIEDVGPAGDGVQTVFNFFLQHPPLPNSLFVDNAEGPSPYDFFGDDGAGNLVPSGAYGNPPGTINYLTGEVTVTFATPLAVGEHVHAYYTFNRYNNYTNSITINNPLTVNISKSSIDRFINLDIGFGYPVNTIQNADINLYSDFVQNLGLVYRMQGNPSNNVNFYSGIYSGNSFVIDGVVNMYGDIQFRGNSNNNYRNKIILNNASVEYFGVTIVAFHATNPLSIEGTGTLINANVTGTNGIEINGNITVDNTFSISSTRISKPSGNLIISTSIFLSGATINLPNTYFGDVYFGGSINTLETDMFINGNLRVTSSLMTVNSASNNQIYLMQNLLFALPSTASTLNFSSSIGTPITLNLLGGGVIDLSMGTNLVNLATNIVFGPNSKYKFIYNGKLLLASATGINVRLTTINRTYTCLSDNISFGSRIFLSINASTTLIGFDRISLPDTIVPTNGITITMDKFFNGSPSRVCTVVSSTTGTYTVNITGPMSFGHYIKVIGCILTNPASLMLTYKEANGGRNVGGILYNNNCSNSFPAYNKEYENIASFNDSMFGFPT